MLDDLPDDMIREIQKLLKDPKNQAALRGVSATQRRISKEIHPDLYRGEKSYLVPSTGARFQDVYDNWPQKFADARERFFANFHAWFTSDRTMVPTRVVGTPHMMDDAFNAYGNGAFLTLLHAKWRKCDRKTLGRDLFVRIKARLARFSKRGSKKYAKTLKVLRRWKRKPSKDEERDLATFAMDALLCESLLFHDKDVKGKAPCTT